jgi:hypothetical protein
MGPPKGAGAVYPLMLEVPRERRRCGESKQGVGFSRTARSGGSMSRTRIR